MKISKQNHIWFSNPQLFLVLGLFGKPFNQDYKVNHVLILSILKEFGLGKDNSMELRILNELEHFIDQVKKMEGSAFNPDSVLRENIANVMLSVLFGQRYDSSDDRLERFARYSQLFMENSSPDLDIVPMARFLPSYRKKIRTASEVNKMWLDLIEQEMAETMKRSAKNSFVEMFVDKAGPEYDHEDLLYIVRDLIMGGADSMIVTIRWALVVLANNPRIQESLQKEIDSVVPGDRLPSMEDKINSPKVDAAFLELLRWKTLAPLSDHHVTMNDSVVSGQFIPAGTLVSMFNACRLQRRFYDGANGDLAPQFRVKLPSFKPNPRQFRTPPLWGTTKYWG